MKKLFFGLFFLAVATAAPYDVISQIATRMDLIQLRLSSPACERFNTMMVTRNTRSDGTVSNIIKTDSFEIDYSQNTVKALAESAISRLRFEWNSPWREEFNGISRSFGASGEPKSNFLILVQQKPDRTSDICLMSLTRP